MTMDVAFLGLGRMGTPMVGHVRDARYKLTVRNPTPNSFEARGSLARWPRRWTGDCVVLMLFGPDSVRAVLAEVVGHLPPGALVIDATTVGPAGSRQFAATPHEAGLRFVDARSPGRFVRPPTARWARSGWV